MSERKPCPHCGSDDLSLHEISDEHGDRCAQVRCRSCGAEGPRLLPPIKPRRTKVVKTEAEAVRAWNERAKA